MGYDKARLYWLAAIAAAAFIICLPATRGGFNWDELNIYFGSSSFMPFYGFGYHRPLFISLLNLERALFGANAVPYHLVNSTLHAANSVMVLIVAIRLLRSRTAAIVSALLFALHPVNSEAVAWVFAGSELLKTFFLLIALNLYLMYREDGKIHALLASALFYLLSCLSGQGALVLPLVILLYDWFVLGNGFRKVRVPALFFSAALMVYMAAFRGAGEVLSPDGARVLNIYNAFSALGYYALKLLLPLKLSLLPRLDDTPIYTVMAVALLGLPFLFIKRWKKEFFLIFFVIIMLLPPFLVAMSAPAYPLGIIYMYSVAIGFSMLASLLLTRIRNPRAMVAVVLALAVIYAAGTMDRAAVWGDRNELWKEAEGANDTSVMHKINLAASLVSSGREDDAKLPLRMALQDPGVSSDEFKKVMIMLHKVSPGSDDEIFDLLSEAKGAGKANLGMGFFYFELYSKDKARNKVILRKAIKYLTKAVEEDQSLVLARYYLGIGYLETGEYEKSIEELLFVNSVDHSGRYSSDMEYYLGLARKLKDLPDKQSTK